MQRTRLMVRITGKYTGTVRKFNNREWISAGCFMDMAANNVLDPNAYNVEFKRMEVK